MSKIENEFGHSHDTQLAQNVDEIIERRILATLGHVREAITHWAGPAIVVPIDQTPPYVEPGILHYHPRWTINRKEGRFWFEMHPSMQEQRVVGTEWAGYLIGWNMRETPPPSPSPARDALRIAVATMFGKHETPPFPYDHLSLVRVPIGARKESLAEAMLEDEMPLWQMTQPHVEDYYRNQLMNPEKWDREQEYEL